MRGIELVIDKASDATEYGVMILDNEVMDIGLKMERVFMREESWDKEEWVTEELDFERRDILRGLGIEMERELIEFFNQCFILWSEVDNLHGVIGIEGIGIGVG